MMQKWYFDLRRTMWSKSIDFHMAYRDEHGFSVAQNLVMERISDEDAADGKVRGPFMSLPVESAQSLIDALWGVGLRPSEGTGSSGSLAATERHLDDMKTIAFHVLDISKAGK